MNYNVINTMLTVIFLALTFADMAAARSTFSTVDDEVSALESRSKRGALSRTMACPSHTTARFMETHARVINNKVNEAKVFGTQGTIREARDINAINCCELKSQMTKSQCTVLENKNFMTTDLTKTLIVVIERMKNNLEYQAELGHSRPTRGGNKKERELKRRLGKERYQNLVRHIRKICATVPLDDNLTPRSYTQYFVRLFRGCKSCQSRGKCSS